MTWVLEEWKLLKLNSPLQSNIQLDRIEELIFRRLSTVFEQPYAFESTPTPTCVGVFIRISSSSMRNYLHIVLFVSGVSGISVSGVSGIFASISVSKVSLSGTLWFQEILSQDRKSPRPDFEQPRFWNIYEETVWNLSLKYIWRG